MPPHQATTFYFANKDYSILFRESLSVKGQHKPHLSPFKDQASFWKKVLSYHSWNRLKSQKLGHKIPAPGTDHKIQNKIIKPPLKNSLGITTKLGKYLISEWAICPGQPYFSTWLNVHDKGMKTTDHLWPPSTHYLNFRLPNPSREFHWFPIRRPVHLCLE